MNKTTLYVPAGIRYIGQWEEFKLSNFPAKCIINKVLPGCGFTRYCLESPWENIILCSPRKMLLENKYEQHKNQVYLVRNQLDSDPQVDKDLEAEANREASRNKIGTSKTISALKILDKELDDPMKNHFTEVKSRLHTELREYFQGHLQHKILVTYDSFRILKEVLEEMGIFQNFYVVIDEMQALMQDARFKSSTEINFLYHLQRSHSALFVSATPMLEEYLDILPEFRDLPYYELDWKKYDLSRIVKPDLTVLKMTSTIKGIVKKVIKEFYEGKRDKVTVPRGGYPVEVVANELVFYMNSVNTIISIIKSNGIPDDQVNILCSRTTENQNRIWEKLGVMGIPEDQRPYKIGSVPLEGKPRKPLTFCTRTVYLGADFYSDCAKSYIFSDANSKYLSIDISQDLPQILGRQRCDENPWKNSAVFYYRLTKSDEEESKALKSKIDKKMLITDELLEVWGKDSTTESQRMALSEKYAASIRYDHYSLDYVAVNREEVIGPDGNKYYRYVPTKNFLVWAAEKRAFDIQSIDYKDRFTIFSALTNEFGAIHVESSENNPIELQVIEFFRVYDSTGDATAKLKFLCEMSRTMTDEALRVVLTQIPNTDKVKTLYLLAGPEVCRSCGYAPSRVERELGVKFYSKKALASEIYGRFQAGQRLSLQEIKSILGDIYIGLNYKKNPKATDLEEFFKIKKVKFQDQNSGKWVHGLELINKLS